MMILIGLCIIPIVVLITRKLKKFDTSLKTKIILNVLLLAIAFGYIAITFLANQEPFQFEITDSGDYYLYSACIFIFTPFLWMVLYHYFRKILRSFRVHKNAKLKSDKELLYYRDDLNKISPSIIMFTSTMETDVKKCIASTILKLKLTGYIEECENELKCTNKNTDELLESEKMILDSIQSKKIDENAYKKLIEKETVDNKYIKWNKSGKLIKLGKMLLTIAVPIILIFASNNFDDYVFENYRIYKIDDKRFIEINDEEEIEKLYKEVAENEYGITYIENIYLPGSLLLPEDEISEYSVAKKAKILHAIDPIFMCISMISVFMALFVLMQQIKYFFKEYARTIKGNELLNKAYALKNYLKDYSLIENRTEEELILWEYYLVYSVILDVNVKLKNNIIENYLENINLR